MTNLEKSTIESKFRNAKYAETTKDYLHFRFLDENGNDAFKGTILEGKTFGRLAKETQKTLTYATIVKNSEEEIKIIPLTFEKDVKLELDPSLPATNKFLPFLISAEISPVFKKHTKKTTSTQKQAQTTKHKATL